MKNQEMDENSAHSYYTYLNLERVSTSLASSSAATLSRKVECIVQVSQILSSQVLSSFEDLE